LVKREERNKPVIKTKWFKVPGTGERLNVEANSNGKERVNPQGGAPAVVSKECTPRRKDRLGRENSRVEEPRFGEQ